MQELSPVQAAALAGGAALMIGGVAGIRHAYGPHPRRAVEAKLESAGKERKRLTEQAHLSRRARRHHMIGEPANVRIVAPATEEPQAQQPANLDVGTLEELLAGLFSLRGDLTALAKELEGLKDSEKAMAA